MLSIQFVEKPAAKSENPIVAFFLPFSLVCVKSVFVVSISLPTSYQSFSFKRMISGTPPALRTFLSNAVIVLDFFAEASVSI